MGNFQKKIRVLLNLFAPAVLIGILGLRTLGDAGNPSIDAIAIAWDARHDAIRDVEIDYAYEDYVLPANPAVIGGRAKIGLGDTLQQNWAEKGEKEYLHTIKKGGVGEPPINQDYEQAWNGKNETGIDHKDFCATVSGKQSHVDPVVEPCRSFFQAESEGKWSELLRKGQVLEVLTNHLGKIYRVKVPEPDARWYRIMDLAEAYGYEPLNIQEYTLGHLMAAWSFEDLQQAGDDIWYPRQVVGWRFGFSQNLDHFDSTQAGNREVYTITKALFNQDIPDSKFKLEFPKGMPVFMADLGTFVEDPDVFSPEAISNRLSSAERYQLLNKPAIETKSGDKVLATSDNTVAKTITVSEISSFPWRGAFAVALIVLGILTFMSWRLWRGKSHA